jgi:hypothetical protein
MFQSFFKIVVAPRENQHPIKVYQSFYVLAIIAYIPLTPYTNACTLSIPIFIPRANHMYAVRTYFSIKSAETPLKNHHSTG